MSLLLNVIFASHARSTHHKLALDALRHLQCDEAAQWTDLIISQHAAYLEGAKAPDDDFKDFKNHVLHVKENFWGGAVSSTEHWYGQFIDHLRSSEWKDAAYAAGVLSHYYSDVCDPLHTDASRGERPWIHRRFERPVARLLGSSTPNRLQRKAAGTKALDVGDDIAAFRDELRRERSGGKPKAPVAVDPKKLRLPDDVQARLPAFVMTAQIYDPDPTRRFVVINSLRYAVGETTRFIPRKKG